MMPTEENRQGLMPSILDRLLDPDSEGTSWRRGYDLQQITDSIRRDLEELLNAHPPFAKVPQDWPECQNSLLTFGMPDLVSATISNPSQKQELGRIVETLVNLFEPRLRKVKAVLKEDTQGGDHHNVRFHIEAEINVDPAPLVTFETVLELTTGHAKIEASLSE